mmetsp:Transcript_15026/g.41164  ORF Transcript_15026/g.41164 Transcript_15026/m.41164 type:complete len:335 (+) Transcript_15026:669-1673(+)
MGPVDAEREEEDLVVRDGRSLEEVHAEHVAVVHQGSEGLDVAGKLALAAAPADAGDLRVDLREAGGGHEWAGRAEVLVPVQEEDNVGLQSARGVPAAAENGADAGANVHNKRALGAPRGRQRLDDVLQDRGVCLEVGAPEVHPCADAPAAPPRGASRRDQVADHLRSGQVEQGRHAVAVLPDKGEARLLPVPRNVYVRVVVNRDGLVHAVLAHVELPVALCKGNQGDVSEAPGQPEQPAVGEASVAGGLEVLELDPEGAGRAARCHVLHARAVRVALALPGATLQALGPRGAGLGVVQKGLRPEVASLHGARLPQADLRASTDPDRLGLQDSGA